MAKTYDKEEKDGGVFQPSIFTKMGWKVVLEEEEVDPKGKWKQPVLKQHSKTKKEG